MKKIIDGKLYDTEKANIVGVYTNSQATSFDFFEEILYKTNKGNYFLYGYGGPMSKYVEYNGNNLSGSEIIKQFNYEQAKNWALENLTVDEIMGEFGEIEEA